MDHRNRREFLADVGRGMLVAGVGSALAADLGLAPAWAGEEERPLVFGRDIEPLVALMQETDPEALLPILVGKLGSGTDIGTLVSAGALANTRTFGGQDYTGYHALMALAPAYLMACELPESHRALPVLKVLHRNTSRIRSVGGRAEEVLHPVEPGELPEGRPEGELLREATRAADFDRAERVFAALAEGPPDEAFHHLQFSVQDEVDVHRVVLAWRSWALLDLCGEENAHSLLRQSVRYCVDSERDRLDKGRPEPAIRAALPRLLDQYKLVGKPLGRRHLDDGEVDRLARVIYESDREQAADAAAAALADGIAPDDVAEAMALAANLLVLHDPGRSRAEPDKPIGSVHGASVGVHASDSANAWWNIARVSRPRNVVAGLVTGAFHTAGQGSRQNDRPYPLPEHLDAVRSDDPAALLREADDAIRSNDQGRACAVVHRCGELGHDPKPVFDLLLRHATCEDGALHAEKYYRTVAEEFGRARPAFRWRHVVALARVTASEYGRTAPGYDQARELLGIA